VRLVGVIRFMVLIAVVGLLIGALAVFVFGGIATVNIVIDAFQEGDYTGHGLRSLTIGMVEVVDDFLLGAVLFITASGLYQLFISPDVDVPEWMRIESVEELKGQLVAVIVVMLGILFLGAATEYSGESILELGIAVALVIAALGVAVFLFARTVLGKRETSSREQ
jgi:uncharacterized membrane protein YqhA